MHLRRSAQRQPRRVVASLLALAVAIGLVAVVQLANPAYACACGAFASTTDPSGAVQLTSEYAMVMLKDGQETIDLRLGVNSVTTQTGLIVPLPATPTVALGSTSTFSSLTTEMTPVRVQRDLWWSWQPGSWFGGALTPGSGGAAAAATNTPTIISQVQLGPLEATTLAASDADGLTAWLDDHGYGLSQGVTDRLQHYVDRNWTFVALKLTGNEPLSGNLAPIRFSFSTDQFVYPEFLSQAATVSQDLWLYIFADHRQTVTFLDGRDPHGQTVWARSVQSPGLTPLGAYLTAIHLNFYSPANQITDDLGISPAATDDEVGTKIVVDTYMSIFGIPIGWMLVAFGAVVVLLIGLLAFVPGRRRRRAA